MLNNKLLGLIFFFCIGQVVMSMEKENNQGMDTEGITLAGLLEKEQQRQANCVLNEIYQDYGLFSVISHKELIEIKALADEMNSAEDMNVDEQQKKIFINKIYLRGNGS
jgi:hypothetical protein